MAGGSAQTQHEGSFPHFRPFKLDADLKASRHASSALTKQESRRGFAGAQTEETQQRQSLDGRQLLGAELKAQVSEEEAPFVSRKTQRNKIFTLRVSVRQGDDGQRRAWICARRGLASQRANRGFLSLCQRRTVYVKTEEKLKTLLLTPRVGAPVCLTP